MVTLLELARAKRIADANKRVAYTPVEIDIKYANMDDVVCERIHSVQKELDSFDDMEEQEKSVLAMHIAYSRLKDTHFSNPFLQEHIRGFKSEGSFVGYYKDKLQMNKLDIEA